MLVKTSYMKWIMQTQSETVDFRSQRVKFLYRVKHIKKDPQNKAAGHVIVSDIRLILPLWDCW